VRGNTYDENDSDYCGIVEEILEFSHPKHQNNVIILCCHWFEPFHVVKVDTFGLVDIKHKSKPELNEPFVLVGQAQQVYYTRYQHNKGRNTSVW